MRLSRFYDIDSDAEFEIDTVEKLMLGSMWANEQLSQFESVDRRPTSKRVEPVYG